MKNVTISLFKEYGLRVGYGINSTYERVCCNQCETGLIVDMGSHTPSGITTSQSFLACRFNSCTVGAEIGKYVESIWFGGNTIFEGTTEVGIRINDAVQVTLDSCYWEGNHGIYLQAGNTGLVHSLRVTNPTLIGKSPPDPTSFIYDIFSLDQVRWADIDLGAVATGPKAAILRTTENTVKVTYRAPAHTSSYLGAGAPRQKNHAYDLGEVVQVTEEGPSAYGAPRTLQFVCIEAGTTEDLNQGDPGWVKKYSWNATSVPDGTAKFSMTGFECVQDFSQLYSVGTHYGNPGTDDARIATRRLELHDGSNHSWWNVRTGYSFSQEDFMIENQGATGAGRILWARSAVHGKGNQMVLGGDPDHPWFSPHNFMIKRDVKIDGPAESGLEVLQLYQQDDDEPFIEFRGAPADEPSKCISNYTNGSSIAGFIRVSINGADYWMPFYTAPTAP